MTPSRPSRPFLDGDTVVSIYASQKRLRERTAALKRAKVAGSNPTHVIADLVARHAGPGTRIVEVGSGRGGVTRLLAELAPRRLTAVDSSRAMLEATRERVASPQLETLHADFHEIPVAAGSFDVAVAAFCLYHSPSPASVCAELARCVGPQGRLVLATKSATSYACLDRLMAESGLDDGATRRPSLYETFSTENMRRIVARDLDVVEVLTDRNEFRFADASQALEYLRTSPKYSTDWSSRARCCAALAAAWPAGGLSTTSIVGYLVARQRSSC